MLFFLCFLPLSALFLDKVFGELPTRFHPICFIGNLAIRIEQILRKGENGKKMFWRGLIAWFFVLFPCLFFAIGVTILPFCISYFLFSDSQEVQFFASFSACCIAFFWTWVSLAPRALAEHAKRVAKPLEEKSLPKAQKELSMIVGRNTSILDECAVARACVESVAENLTDSILATIFWTMFGVIFAVCINNIFGNTSNSVQNPLLSYQAVSIVFFITLHRVSNTLDAMWGKKNEKYINFGTMSAIMDDILNYLPARMGLFCVVIACFFVKNCNASRALSMGLKYRNAHESPNSAWTESAFAGALNLKLGGPAHYVGIRVNHPYLGEGSLEAKAHHIYSSVKLMWISSIIFACFMGCLTYFIY